MYPLRTRFALGLLLGGILATGACSSGSATGNDPEAVYLGSCRPRASLPICTNIHASSRSILDHICQNKTRDVFLKEPCPTNNVTKTCDMSAKKEDRAVRLEFYLYSMPLASAEKACKQFKDSFYRRVK